MPSELEIKGLARTIALGTGLDPDAEDKPDDQGRSHPIWQSYRQTARDALIAAVILRTGLSERQTGLWLAKAEIKKLRPETVGQTWPVSVESRRDFGRETDECVANRP